VFLFRTDYRVQFNIAAPPSSKVVTVAATSLPPQAVAATAPIIQ